MYFYPLSYCLTASNFIYWRTQITDDVSNNNSCKLYSKIISLSQLEACILCVLQMCLRTLRCLRPEIASLIFCGNQFRKFEMEWNIHTTESRKKIVCILYIYFNKKKLGQLGHNQYSQDKIQTLRTLVKARGQKLGWEIYHYW